MVVFTFSVSALKDPFWALLVQKIKIVFKVKFVIITNSKMQNSMVMLTFFFFNYKYPYFSKNLQQNFKNVCLR